MPCVWNMFPALLTFAIIIMRVLSVCYKYICLIEAETLCNFFDFSRASYVTLQKEDIRRLEAFEMWIWRRMIKVSWTEHKTNEEVLQMVNTEREMMETLRSRQKRWLGHILRHDSLLRITLEGRIQGKKGCGRPIKCSWIGYWRRRKTISVRPMMN